MRQLIACLLGGALLLTGCAERLPLLQIPPATLGEDRLVQQRMQLSWNGETHVLENMLETSRLRLQVIGLAMGVRVYSFSYDGQAVTPGPGHLPPGLSESRIANDMLLIHTPTAALRQALPAGWRLEETSCRPAAQRCRRLFWHDDLAVEVQYQTATPWQGRSLLFDHQQGYQLILDSANES